MRNAYSTMILVLSLTSAQGFAGELFPYNPPGNSCESTDNASPMLTEKDYDNASKIAGQIHNLSDDEKKTINARLYNRIEVAVKTGKLTQALFFTQILKEAN